MRSLYLSALVVHVIVAILGLGTIASIALFARVAERSGRSPAEAAAWLGPLLRYSAWSLAAMFVTGMALDMAVGGAFHDSWWFRGSALLLIATGALHGQARAAVRHGGALRRIEGIGYAMCALIFAITVLMEVKPF